MNPSGREETKTRKRAWYWGIPRVFKHFIGEELKQHSLLPTLKNSLRARELKFTQALTLSDLLSRRAKESGKKTFFYFENQTFSFTQADRVVNQVSHWLKRLSAKNGDGLGIMLDNCPEFLLGYFASQRIGMCAVPVNTELKGDGLAYLIGHSEIKMLLIGEKFLPTFLALKSEFPKLTHLLVLSSQAATPPGTPYIVANFRDAYQEKIVPDPKWSPNPDDISTIMYTSGTTGRPKGVSFYYSNTWVRRLGLFANLIFEPTDKLYTCLPLFHANALFLTFSAGLWMGIPVILSRKFSGSRFWSEIEFHQATVFSAIGAMIPILLKTPEMASDSRNSVRLVLSAACPVHSWKEFERRFQLTLWEGYSAVDGGQNFIYNLGNAPVGSIGKPMGVKYKIELEDGSEAPDNQPGELLFKVRDRKRAVSYFKDQDATDEKVKNGYLHSGDLVYRDEQGYLYFVGRKTDSMRRRGENVSAYEVESTLATHPDILECAVYGVPSVLAEEEIMCALVAVPGKTVNPRELEPWLSERLASYAVPRFFRMMSELPKTGTLRVMKAVLKEQGVTPDTVDLRPEVPR